MKRLSRSEMLVRAQLAAVDAIYGAVSDSTRWDEVARAATALVGGGVSAVIHRTGDKLAQQRLLAAEMDPDYAASYEQYYGRICPWVLKTPRNRPVLQVNDDMLTSPEEIERSEFFADWLRPQGIRYSFDASIALGPDQAVDLAAIRPIELGPLDADERRIVGELIPHLKRAVELLQRLEIAQTQQAALALASRRLGAGILLVDAHRRILHCDPEADRFLSEGGLSSKGGRLRAPPAADEMLGEAVARATGAGKIASGRSGTLMPIRRRSGSLPLSIAVGPLDDRDRPVGLPGPLAMIVITDPERSGGPGEEGLRNLFDLTPAEAKLLAALCAGETLASYAEATGISLNTVKTHLKHVFDKTGETRQADLIRRVTTDVALRLGGKD